MYSHRIIDNDDNGEESSYASIPDASAVTTQDIQAAGIVLTAADFDSALGEARASYSDSIGAPKVRIKPLKFMMQIA